jgi:ribulose-phosphate 3-epimerase
MVSFKIASSLLSSDLSRLEMESKRMLRLGVDYLHLDVMDGHFVPNLTFGPPVIACLREHVNAFLDCHLMVSNPSIWIESCAKAGVSSLTFHIETVDSKNVTDIINRILLHNMKVAIAVNPQTDIREILEYTDLVDMILVMTVDPGFGGQSIQQECLKKVTILRSHCPNLNIQVDGGISLETLPLALGAGANIFVVGSAIFNSDNPEEIVGEFRKQLEGITTPVKPHVTDYT